MQDLLCSHHHHCSLFLTQKLPLLGSGRNPCQPSAFLVTHFLLKGKQEQSNMTTRIQCHEINFQNKLNLMLIFRPSIQGFIRASSHTSFFSLFAHTISQQSQLLPLRGTETARIPLSRLWLGVEKWMGRKGLVQDLLRLHHHHCSLFLTQKLPLLGPGRNRPFSFFGHPLSFPYWRIPFPNNLMQLVGFCGLIYGKW